MSPRPVSPPFFAQFSQLPPRLRRFRTCTISCNSLRHALSDCACHFAIASCPHPLCPLGAGLPRMACPASSSSVTQVERQVGPVFSLLDVISDQPVTTTIAFVVRVLAFTIRPLDHDIPPSAVGCCQQFKVRGLWRRLRSLQVRHGNARLKHLHNRSDLLQ